MLTRGIRPLCAVAVLLLALGSADAQIRPGANGPPVQVRTVHGSWVPVGTIAGFVGPLMETCAVTRLGLAVINDAKVIYTGNYTWPGSSGEASREPADPFRAASLGKPVFAYLVMKLVDRKLLDLDTPLFRYLPRPLFTYPGYEDLRYDRRYQAITARLVLSHQTGFQNWRRQTASDRLKITFFPGQKFGYSGEGYRYLQFVVEQKLGKGLAELAREEVFVPLGMTRTGFDLEEHGNGRLGTGAGHAPKALKGDGEDSPGGVESMLTTAADYGRFVTAVLNGEGLSVRNASEMLRPQVQIPARGLSGPQAEKIGENTDGLSWGLGWGRFETRAGGAIFHMGRETDCENYVVVFLKDGVGVVVLSSGAGREAISPRLVARLIGDGYSPFPWIGY